MRSAAKFAFLFAVTLTLAACGSSSSPTSVHDAGADSGGAVTHHDAGHAEPKDAGKDAAKPANDSGLPDVASHDTGSSDAAHDAIHDSSMKTTPDASSGPDASETSDASPLTKPITAPAETWTWVPFPTAFCANGTSTGIGVNLSTASSRVLIYLEGGGACWSEETCYTLMTASNFTTGYGESEFTSESTDTTYLAQPGGFFDRTAAANPFRDYSYVYVPYCTGDVHSGNYIVEYGTNTANFVGWKNIGAYLARVVPTFPSADRVVLAGSSAGGFGALFNWSRTQEAFGSIRVDLIDDSGTAIPNNIDPAVATSTATWNAAWNLAGTAPLGCTTCATDLSALYGFYETAFASHRGALLSYTDDTVLPTYYGISPTEFTMGLDEDETSYFPTTSPLQTFTIGASGHVLWFDPTLMTAGGVTLQQFVSEMVTDDPTWANAGP